MLDSSTTITDPTNSANLPETPQSPLDSAIAKLHAEAVAPHYRYVRFLATLAGLMLTVLVTQGSSQTHPNRPAELLQLWAMICLCVCLIAGGIAARGEVDQFDWYRERLEHLKQTHENSVIHQVREAEKIKQARPREFFRLAFPLQYGSGLFGVALLLVSKAVFLFPCTTSNGREGKPVATQAPSSLSAKGTPDKASK